MNSCAVDIWEINRSVAILADRVIKTIEYSGETQKVESALTEVQHFFDRNLNAKQITTVKHLEIKRNCLIIHQARVASRVINDISAFFLFTNEVMRANRSGWIFGDINYKNVIFDGTQFRVIDFEPFTKTRGLNAVEYRVTPPYFHPLDKLTGNVTSLTDRLGLIGLYLRLKLGFRKQKRIFSLDASSLHDLALMEGDMFMENLQSLGEKYA